MFTEQKIKCQQFCTVAALCKTVRLPEVKNETHEMHLEQYMLCEV